MTLIAALLAPALLLAACGEGSQEKPTAKPSLELPTGDVKVPDGVTLTKAGTELKFGQQALVAYTPNPKRNSALSITVQTVQKGKIADFAAYQLGATANTTPYYAKVKIVNIGTGDLSRLGVPVYAVDGRNQLIPPASFDNAFTKCPSTPFPEGFAAGKTYQACLVFFVPAPGALVQMSYRPLQAFEPITWQGTILPPAQKAKKAKQPKKKAKKGQS
jgi:hypothetical protein